MTTQWQSMFGGGACTVSFFDDFSGTPVWSGQLGLSQSSPSVSGASGLMHAEVGAEGVVSLHSDDGLTPSYLCQINVMPLYDTSAVQTQAIAMSAPDGMSNHGGVSNDGDPLNGANHINLTTLDAGGSTPASAEFAAMTGVNLAFAARAA